ncbi:MAG: RIP metalloprotease RseP [Alphaproteobacteria bacterium]|nr:RIP metalloprotease RseP [Alphaproteobacteria bacterium]
MDTLLSVFTPEGFLNTIHYAWSFFLILSVIVFIHEFGHYIIAKWCGVKIEAFSIGFGKELFGWNDKSGTRWKFSLIPMGGYVKMFGDSGAASTPDAEKAATMTDEEKDVSFHYKPLWKKAAIVAAGPAFNFILTISILTGILLTYGMASTTPVVSVVLPDSVASTADFKSGDIIVSIDGKEVKTFGDIPRIIATNTGTPVHIVSERDGTIIEQDVTPRMTQIDDAFGNKVDWPMLGIQSQEHTSQDMGFFEAVLESVKRTYNICATSLYAVGQMITGDRDASELKGPIGIAKLSGQATVMDFGTIIWFIAMLSANLGLVNLFPIPLLDGGHLLFYAIEATTGRPLAEKFQEYGFRVGFALIACLMAFTILNDLRTIF